MNINSMYMKKFIFSVIICILAFSILSAAPQAMAKSIENQGKKVIGYYTSWSAYSGFTPDKVDATKLTHINYGFANISEDLKVILGDSYTLLLKTIREKLDIQGKKDGRYYALSIAGGASSMYIENVELWNIHKYIDFANIMTYDMHGVWDKYTDFNSPLYANNSSPNYVKWSINSAVKSWINAGFPKEKIVMGVPFFGKQYNMVNLSANGLYQTYKGGSSISYADIVSKYLNKPGVIKYYHSESMVPWLYDGMTFISYENEESIEHKAEYIKSKGLGGVMIWELSNDPNKILLDRLNKKLK